MDLVKGYLENYNLLPVEHGTVAVASDPDSDTYGFQAERHKLPQETPKSIRIKYDVA